MNENDLVPICGLFLNRGVLNWGSTASLITRSFCFQFLYVHNQYETDGDFPTLPFPNPEESETLKMALKTADENDSDVVVANDPDADRMAVAEKRPDGSWKAFTGEKRKRIRQRENRRGRVTRNTKKTNQICGKSKHEMMQQCAAP